VYVQGPRTREQFSKPDAPDVAKFVTLEDILGYISSP
jgi:hypothetical protein